MDISKSGHQDASHQEIRIPEKNTKFRSDILVT